MLILAMPSHICYVCLAPATDPRQIPCGNGHIVCLKCLQDLVTYSKNTEAFSFPCPCCRGRVDIPAEGLEHYPKPAAQCSLSQVEPLSVQQSQFPSSSSGVEDNGHAASLIPDLTTFWESSASSMSEGQSADDSRSLEGCSSLEDKSLKGRTTMEIRPRPFSHPPQTKHDTTSVDQMQSIGSLVQRQIGVSERSAPQSDETKLAGNENQQAPNPPLQPGADCKRPSQNDSQPSARPFGVTQFMQVAYALRYIANNFPFFQGNTQPSPRPGIPQGPNLPPSGLPRNHFKPRERTYPSYLPGLGRPAGHQANPAGCPAFPLSREEATRYGIPYPPPLRNPQFLGLWQMRSPVPTSRAENAATSKPRAAAQAPPGFFRSPYNMCRLPLLRYPYPSNPRTPLPAAAPRSPPVPPAAPQPASKAEDGDTEQKAGDSNRFPEDRQAKSIPPGSGDDLDMEEVMRLIADMEEKQRQANLSDQEYADMFMTQFSDQLQHESQSEERN